MQAVSFYLHDWTWEPVDLPPPTKRWIEVSAHEHYFTIKVPESLDYNDKKAVLAWMLTWTHGMVFPNCNEDDDANDPWFDGKEAGLGVAIVPEGVLEMLNFPWPSGMDSIDDASANFAAAFCRKNATALHEYNPPERMRKPGRSALSP